MRPPTNKSAPRMLFPPTPTASASTHAAPFGTPIPTCSKATPQAGMRPWPHISDTNRTKNLFSATTTAASSYGLAALTGPPSYRKPLDDYGRFQIQENAFHPRLWSHASYKNSPNGSTPRASLLRGTANRESNPRLPSHQGRQSPPFPYPERLCIMTPYPPQQQERTPYDNHGHRRYRLHRGPHHPQAPRSAGRRSSPSTSHPLAPPSIPA